MKAEEVRERARKCYQEPQENKRVIDLIFTQTMALAAILELLEEERDAKASE